MPDKNDYKNDPMKQVTDSSLEEVITLFINNIKLLNDTVTRDKDTKSKAIEEIMNRLDAITDKDYDKIRNIERQNTKTIANIFQRIIESNKIDVTSRDIDYVVAELIIEAYNRHTKRKKYQILMEGGKWLLLAILTSGIGYIVLLIIELAKKLPN